MESVIFFSSGGGKAKPMKQPEAVTRSVFLSSAVYFLLLFTLRNLACKILNCHILSQLVAAVRNNLFYDTLP